MHQNWIDHWVRDCILTDHVIRCNQIPEYIPSFGYRVVENPDISSKWSRTIECKSPNVFYQITALMNMQHLAYDSKLRPRRTVLAYLLRRKHNESLTLGIFNGILRWVFYVIIIICAPFYLLKWGIVESLSHLRKILQIVLK